MPEWANCIRVIESAFSPEGKGRNSEIDVSKRITVGIFQLIILFLLESP